MRGTRSIGLLLATLLSAVARRSPPPLPNYAEDTGNVRPSRRLRFEHEARRTSGTYHRDLQKQASLRRRMGGNAMRIKMARCGFVFTDSDGVWWPADRVLPEEVEARHLELVRDYNKWPDTPHARRMGNYIQCEDGYYDTEIRGMSVRITPTFCGPVRFEQLEAA